MLARLRRGRGSIRPTVVIRDYGRDSLLVWSNLLLGAVFARLGLRLGVVSEERLIGTIQADAATMRRQGYLVVSTETFALPVVGSRDATARWYRITYELTGVAKPD